MAMEFTLHSRVQRIGGVGNCGYRDIWIHEMTESEIDSLKMQRWLGLVAGLGIGTLIGGGIMVASILRHGCAAV